MATTKAVKLKAGIVNILGTDWKVVLRDFGPGSDGTPMPEMGYCDGHAMEIHINEAMAESSRMDTLQHEVMHAIEKTLGIEIGEKAVRAFATALRAFYKSNPKVAEWLIR